MRLFLFLSLLVSVCCYSQEKSYDAVWGLLRKGNLQEAQMKLNEMDDRSDPVYLTILGEIHSRKGRINQAIGAFGRALLRFEELEQIQTENYAIALNDLGLAFWNAGNESKALEYLLRARDIRLINFGQDDEQLAGSYNDIGLVYSTSQPRKALNNYEKALEIYRTIYADNHEKIAQALVNIGIIQLKTGIYGAAIGNFEDALSIWQEIYGRNQHPNEAFVHVNLAQTYAGFGDRETSLRELDKAISIYINTYGNEHPDLASTYNILGSFRLQQDDHEGALNAYQKAIQANVPGFDKSDYYINPSTSNYYNGNVLLNSLLYKAQALETKHFRETLKFSELEGALASLLKCDTLIDKLRQTRKLHWEKLRLKFTRPEYGLHFQWGSWHSDTKAATTSRHFIFLRKVNLRYFWKQFQKQMPRHSLIFPQICLTWRIILRVRSHSTNKSWLESLQTAWRGYFANGFLI